jgi:hypothetical protein
VRRRIYCRSAGILPLCVHHMGLSVKQLCAAAQRSTAVRKCLSEGIHPFCSSSLHEEALDTCPRPAQSVASVSVASAVKER